MTADREITRLDNPIAPTLFIHYRNQPPKEILGLLPDFRGHLLCDDSSPHTFAQIKEKYPSSLVKVALNGPNTHPLVKYLKRNCQSLYDYQVIGAKRIEEESGCFVMFPDSVTKYYPQSKFKELETELKAL